MNPTDQMSLIPPAGMFTVLAPLAKKGTVMVMISGEADNLRVNITQKGKTEDSAFSISLFAPPAELDTELPAAIANARGTAPVLKSVADQVSEQVQPDKPARQKPAAAASKKTAAAKPRKTTITKPRPSVQKSAVKAAARKPAAPRAKFTKDQCLAEYVRLKQLHGDALTMDLYAKNAKFEGAEIGRSFERMFGGWKKFAKAGEARIARQVIPPAGDSKPAAQPASSAGPKDLPTGWPFPPAPRGVYHNTTLQFLYTMPVTDPVMVGQLMEIPGFGKMRAVTVTKDRIDAEPATEQKTAPVPLVNGPAGLVREVYDTEGAHLGNTTQQPTVNEMMTILTDPPLPPVKVVAVGKTRITVEAITADVEA